MRMIREKTVVQLTAFPRLFPVNCYLVEEEKDLTLIDAALPGSLKAILDAADAIGKPIARIVITHAHGDHIGALDGLKEKLPDAKVYISERDGRLLQGDRSLDLDAGEADMPIRGSVPKHVRTRPDVLMKDGDRIGSLMAIAAPGHTPGSMAFFDARNRILIAGDAFQTRGGIAVAGQIRWRFPFPAMATWNAAAALDSACKLADLQPSLLAVGHGEMENNPAAAMQRAIEECAAILRKKGLYAG